MLLRSKMLAAIAGPHHLLGISQDSRPEETVVVGLGGYFPRGRVVAAFPLVDVLEQAESLLPADAALEKAAHTAFVQLIVDDGVGTGAALDLPAVHLVPRELVAGEVVEQGPCPRRHGVYGEDAFRGRLGIPRL